MQIFATMSQALDVRKIADHARRVEAIGYDGLLIPEAVHDGLLGSMVALSATTRLRVITSVLIAFPRSPMTTAHAAWDLQAISGGRFELGLGTQVRANIVHRFSTPWTSPVPRMREYVESLKAIFHSFQTGEELRYEGEHYQFSRLQPFFNPGPLEGSAPPIHLGAVGPDMTRMAGGTADGLLSHPTSSSASYLREVTTPLLIEGATRRNREATSCPVLAGGFIVTGRDAEAVAGNRDWVKEQFSFLFSTPTYWLALDRVGFGEVGRELHRLSKEGRWNEMKSLVRDDLIDRLVPTGCYAEIAETLLAEFGPVVERMTFPVPDDPVDDPQVKQVLEELHSR